MDSSFSPSARPDPATMALPSLGDPLRIAPEPPDDGPSWQVTFADLALQLFAFLLIGLVVTHAAAPARGRAGEKLVQAPSTFVAPSTERSPTDVAGEALADREVVSLAPHAARRATTTTAADAETVALAAPVEEQRVDAADPIVAAALRAEALGAPVAKQEPAEPQARTVTAARMQATGRYLSALVAGIAGEKAPEVSVRADEVTVTLADGIGFDSGRSELSTAVRHLLEELRAILRSVPGTAIEVSGHTDDRPIQTARFPSNLELSLARASEVATFLSAGHADLERRIFASGYGDRRPRASNADDAGRAQNRRVEIRLLTLGS